MSAKHTKSIEEAGTCCENVADVISCCQPVVVDDVAQCSYLVHALDALLLRRKLDCFSSFTA